MPDTARCVQFMALRLPVDISDALAVHSRRLGKSKTAFVRDLVACSIGMTVDIPDHRGRPRKAPRVAEAA